MSNRIALNFFPLATNQFKFTLYRTPYTESDRPESGSEKAVCRTLEVNGKRNQYWTLFQKIDGSKKEVLEPYDNTYATIAALKVALIQNCETKLNTESFRVSSNFRRTIEIITDEYPEGERVILLEPYFLRTTQQFGFIAESRFHPKSEFRGTRRALQLSLALNKRGQANRNYHADHYRMLANFVKKYHNRIFPLVVPGGDQIRVALHFVDLTAESLEEKCYIVGRQTESRSQFTGIKESGPLQATPNDLSLYFVYREQDRAFSRELFRALRGDTFTTFPGMGKMFNLPISKDNVTGTVISDFTPSEIQRVRDLIANDTSGRNAVPIILTPFSRHDPPDQNEPYWRLKHAFLEKDLPIQVVAKRTVTDRDKLKWSAAGIGLQIFAKLGGIPWKVKPRLKKCLIVGIGQAHQKSGLRTGRFFAYSVLTDSSGIFEEVRVLGDNTNEQNYINHFGKNLKRIFERYSSKYSSFVVHTTFAIRQCELETIASVLADTKDRSQSGEFVCLKFNDRNRFFGFSLDHNSLVPFESTTIQLSKSEYLVWFEGLRHGQTTLYKAVGNPLHIQFAYPHEVFSESQHKAQLQDAINLSGANWRGFNAKNLPVSVYYAQLIARYLKEFNRLQLPPVDVNIIKPWFL